MSEKKGCLMIDFITMIYNKIKNLKSLLFSIDFIKECKIRKLIGNIFKYEHNENNIYFILSNEKNGKEIIRNLTKNQQNNIKDVCIQFQQLLAENNVSEEQKIVKLSDPDFVEVLTDAYEISKSMNDIEKRKILSDLIYKKFKAEDEDESNTLSQSIRIMKTLTKNHLKLNSLFYMFRSGCLKEFKSPEELNAFYDKYVSKLIDIPIDKIRDIGTTVVGSGCAVTYTFGSSVSSFFDNHLAEYYAKLITKENISTEEEKQKNIIEILKYGISQGLRRHSRQP